jgi:nucleotidyltransferase substrate binding protein (TIGR01987 family)
MAGKYNTEQLKKSYESLRVALHLAEEASYENNIPIQQALRDSCIQRFEYCIELSWKTSMKILGTQVAAAKPAIREMARNSLIKNPEVWFDFIDCRNNSSHAYDEDIAAQVFIVIKTFLPNAEELLENLEKIQ